MAFKKLTTKSISNRLSELYGGKWTWDRNGSWWCDDGKRRVTGRCSNFYEDSKRPLPPAYYLYGAGVPERVFL